jgi:hypothetical protein
MGSPKKLVVWLLRSVAGQLPQCFSVHENGEVWIFPGAQIRKP